MHFPYALNDVFFARALASLPATLLEAMHAAELTDPGVLRLYPRYTSEELGIQREAHVDNSQSSTFSTCFSQCFSQRMVLTYAGAASAAVLATKAASSCHEPRLVDPSVVSSFASASVSLPVSPADGHPASNAPDRSGIPAQTDSASTATLKNRDFHGDSARFQRISQKSRILDKVRESPPVSGLSNLDGCPPIKLVQFLHAESSSNGSPEASSASGSVQNSARDAEESMVTQVETQTPKDMAKKIVRDSSARPPPHMRAWKGWYDEGNNTDHHNTGRSCNGEEVPERYPC